MWQDELSSQNRFKRTNEGTRKHLTVRPEERKVRENDRNRINHPTREMRKLFADYLFDIILNNVCIDENTDNGAMYNR